MPDMQQTWLVFAYEIDWCLSFNDKFFWKIIFEICFEEIKKIELVLVSLDILALEIIFVMRSQTETQSLKPHRWEQYSS